MSGEFGVVHHGVYMPDINKVPQSVAVKTLKGGLRQVPNTIMISYQQRILHGHALEKYLYILLLCQALCMVGTTKILAYLLLFLSYELFIFHGELGVAYHLLLSTYYQESITVGGVYSHETSNDIPYGYKFL